MACSAASLRINLNCFILCLCSGLLGTSVMACKIRGITYENGNTYVDGSYVYQCSITSSRWSTSAIACFGGGQRIAQGDIFDDGQKKYDCRQGPSLRTSNSARAPCSRRGVMHALNSTWIETSYLMQCQSGGRTMPIGCITPEGKPVLVGEEKTEGRFIIKCIQSGNSIRYRTEMAPDAQCVDKYKQKHDFGSWWVEKFNFNMSCQEKGSIKLANCVTNRGTPLILGDTTVEGNYNYSCKGTVQSWSFQSKTARFIPCIDNYKSYAFNSSWNGTNFAKRCKEQGQVAIIGCINGDAIVPGNTKFVPLGATSVKACINRGRSWSYQTAGCLNFTQPDPETAVRVSTLIDVDNSGVIVKCDHSGWQADHCKFPSAGNKDGIRVGVGNWQLKDWLVRACYSTNNYVRKVERTIPRSSSCESRRLGSSPEGTTRFLQGVVFRCFLHPRLGFIYVATDCLANYNEFVRPGSIFLSRNTFKFCALTSGFPMPYIVGCVGPTSDILVPVGSTIETSGSVQNCTVSEEVQGSINVLKETFQLPDISNVDLVEGYLHPLHNQVGTLSSDVSGDTNAIPLPRLTLTGQTPKPIRIHRSGVQFSAADHQSRMKRATVLSYLDEYDKLGDASNTHVLSQLGDKQNDWAQTVDPVSSSTAATDVADVLSRNGLQQNSNEKPHLKSIGNVFGDKIIKPGDTVVAGSVVLKSTGRGLKIDTCVIKDQQLSENVFGQYLGAKWCCLGRCRCHFAGCTGKDSHLNSIYFDEQDALINQHIINMISQACPQKEGDDKMKPTNCVYQMVGSSKVNKMELDEYRNLDGCGLTCNNDGGILCEGRCGKVQDCGSDDVCVGADDVIVNKGKVFKSRKPNAYKEDSDGYALTNSEVLIKCTELSKPENEFHMAVCRDKLWVLTHYGGQPLKKSHCIDIEDGKGECKKEALLCGAELALVGGAAVTGPLGPVLLIIKYSLDIGLLAKDIYTIFNEDTRRLKRQVSDSDSKLGRLQQSIQETIKRTKKSTANLMSDVKNSVTATARKSMKFISDDISTAKERAVQHKKSVTEALRKALGKPKKTNKLINKKMKPVGNLKKAVTAYQLTKLASEGKYGELAEKSSTFVASEIVNGKKFQKKQKKAVKKFFKSKSVKEKLAKAVRRVFNKALRKLPLGCLIPTAYTCIKEFFKSDTAANMWQSVKDAKGRIEDFVWGLVKSAEQRVSSQLSSQPERRMKRQTNATELHEGDPQFIHLILQLNDLMRTETLLENPVYNQYVELVLPELAECWEAEAEKLTVTKESLRDCFWYRLKKSHQIQQFQNSDSFNQLKTILASYASLDRNLDRLAELQGYGSAHDIQNAFDDKIAESVAPVNMVNMSFESGIDWAGADSEWGMYTPVIIRRYHEFFPIKVALLDHPFPDCNITSVFKYDNGPKHVNDKVAGSFRLGQPQIDVISDEEGDSVISIEDNMVADQYYLFQFQC